LWRSERAEERALQRLLSLTYSAGAEGDLVASGVHEVGEIDLAAAAEVYGGGSFAARTLSIGESPTMLTRHGLRLMVTPVGAPIPRLDRLVAPGGTGTGPVDPAVTSWAAKRGLAVERPGDGRTREFGFDPVLGDLARQADRATARAPPPTSSTRPRTCS
jgi:hypothetical protein